MTGSAKTNQEGTLSSIFSNCLRWATLLLQPNVWLMIDEVQAFTNEHEILHLMNYYCLSLPTSKSMSSTISYSDDGVRLTCGLVSWYNRINNGIA